MPTPLEPICQWCPEIDYGLWLWPQCKDKEILLNRYATKFGLDYEQAAIYADIVERAHKCCQGLFTIEDVVEAEKQLACMPVVLADRECLMICFQITLDDEILGLLPPQKRQRTYYYKVFAPTNPDQFLEAMQALVDVIVREMRQLLGHINRYMEQEPITAANIARVRELVEKLQRRLRDLEQLRDIISRAIRDPSGRFIAGTRERQRLWREIRAGIEAWKVQITSIIRWTTRPRP